jgi:hypothetical protein
MGKKFWVIRILLSLTLIGLIIYAAVDDKDKEEI